MILGKCVVPFDVVDFAEFFGFCPGLGFDADKFDVASISVAPDKIVAEFVQKFDGAGVFGVKNRAWRTIFGAVARGDIKFWVGLAEFSDEFV